MARYFIDVLDGEKLITDEEGVELSGLDAARAEAMSTLGDMARDVRPDSEGRAVVIRIRDEGGKPVLMASLVLTVEQLTD